MNNIEPLYKFLLIADVHIDEEKWGETPGHFWKYSHTHLADALQFACETEADFIISAGDQVTNANYDMLDKEWKTYHNILAESDFSNPIYESMGNHEIRDKAHVKEETESYIYNTGLDSELTTINKHKPYFCVKEPLTSDIFIFMAPEKSYEIPLCDEFTDEQMEFVEGIIDENYDKCNNIFIIQHALIEGFGPGDNSSKPYYGGGLDKTGKNTRRFMKILNRYKKLIWVSGHSHMDFELGFNYSDDDGRSCRMVHIGSVSSPTRIVNGSLSYEQIADTSQGYLVSVFENKIDFKAINFANKSEYQNISFSINGNTNIKNVPCKSKEETSDYMPEEAELNALAAHAKIILGVNYEYSSYNQYQLLKKTYLEYVKDSSKVGYYNAFKNNISNLISLINNIELKKH